MLKINSRKRARSSLHTNNILDFKIVGAQVTSSSGRDGREKVLYKTILFSPGELADFHRYFLFQGEKNKYFLW